MFQFSDITEDNFESILRRCAVVKTAARCFGQAFIDQNFKDVVDISDHGIYSLAILTHMSFLRANFVFSPVFRSNMSSK